MSNFSFVLLYFVLTTTRRPTIFTVVHAPGVQKGCQACPQVRTLLMHSSAVGLLFKTVSADLRRTQGLWPCLRPGIMLIIGLGLQMYICLS